jgi:hypothetical protein
MQDHLLFHHLQVDFLHIDLLVELWREFGLLEQFSIDRTRHLEDKATPSNGREGRRESVMWLPFAISSTRVLHQKFKSWCC